jgi:hypothetical protein
MRFFHNNISIEVQYMQNRIHILAYRGLFYFNKYKLKSLVEGIMF